MAENFDKKNTHQVYRNTNNDAQNGKKTIESIKKDVKKNRQNNQLYAIAFCVFALLIVGFVLLNSVFTLKHLQVQGECSYSQEQLMQGMGIKPGDKLYTINKKEVKENAKNNLSYVENIDVSIKLPSTLIVKVMQTIPRFYITLNDSMYLLSDKLRVLENTNSAEKVETAGAILLEIGGITKCVEGEILVADEKMKEILFELCTLLETHGVIDQVTRIDVTDIYNINLMYGSQYLVKLGDEMKLDLKIRFMKGIIDEGLSEGTSGELDVSNYEEGKFKNFT